MDPKLPDLDAQCFKVDWWNSGPGYFIWQPWYGSDLDEKRGTLRQVHMRFILSLVV
jgi:hypothetical protein